MVLEKPIFIIAMHRTGSTLLRNILNDSSSIAMATDEMHIFVPFGEHFGKNFNKFGSLRIEANVDKLIEYFYKGKIRGKFWQDYIKLGITKEKIKNRFLKTDRSLKSFITILLYEYRNIEKKPRVGVKFPLHFSRTKMLKRWFPDSKIILLHRDIRAICSSKLNDKETLRRKNKWGILAHYFTLLYFIFDYLWLAKYYKQNSNLFYIIEYADLILYPNKTIPTLCKFCEILPEDNMYFVLGKPSSYFQTEETIFDKTRIDYWKKSLNKIDIWLITTLTNSSKKHFLGL